MVPSERKELPPKYYLSYFQYLLDFVKNKYKAILISTEWDFLQAFDRLSEDEQCLFIRFTNRRGRFFKTDKLKYPEIAAISTTLRQLIDKGFLLKIDSQHQHWIGDILAIYNKTELLQLAQMLGLATKGKASLHKEALLDWLLENSRFDDILPWLNPETEAIPQVIQVGYEAEVQMLKFLFFGSRYGDMSDFVVRDLGLMQYEQFDEDMLVPHFQTRAEAEDKLKVSLAKEDFFLMQEQHIDALEIYHWFLAWHEQHYAQLSEIALPSYERLILRVATFLEKNKHPDQALAIYRYSVLPPSRERQVRLLHKQKNTPEALALCEQMLAEPQNADEQFFALDFTNKIQAIAEKKKAKKSVTTQLQQASSITLDKAWQRQVELGVINYYEQQHKKACFSENHLWRSLFGLLFWDIIFDTTTLAIHHPLQRSPSDLFKPHFFEKRKEKMEERLQILTDAEACNRYLHQTFFEKYGITNPLVDWYGGLFPILLALTEKLSPEQITAVMLEMAKNLRENIRGFPDLFVWDDGDYEFIEVKSPTDSLSNQQLYWLKFFETINLRARVLRITWRNESVLFADT